MGNKTEKKKGGICNETNPWMGRLIFSFAFSVFFVANYAQCSWIFYPLYKEGIMSFFNLPWLFLHEILFVLTIWSYVSAMMSNPGYVPKDLVSPAAKIDMLKLGKYEVECQKCDPIAQKSEEANDKPVYAWKPPRAYHCKVCKQCVFKMDHHCVWINNCVGAGNSRFFVLFLGYTVIWCSAFLFNAIIMGGVRMIKCKEDLLPLLIPMNKPGKSGFVSGYNSSAHNYAAMAGESTKSREIGIITSYLC